MRPAEVLPPTSCSACGAGRISSLNQLNDALAANNLQATFVSGKLTITTTNEAASATIGAITGSAVGASQAFAAGTTAPAPVVDPRPS